MSDFFERPDDLSICLAMFKRLSGLMLGSFKNNMQSYASKLSKSNLSSVSEIVLCDVIRT